jgi:type IV pilus modification protein PilV
MIIFPRTKTRRNSQQGSTLIELLIAMLVLATGMAGVTTLLVTAIASNNRNGKDTTATLLAQKVIEEISAQNVYNDTVVTTTDCAGNSYTFATDPGAAPGGAGANLKSDGTIDFTQSYANVTAGYAMRYVDCATGGGAQITYDVRWNVMNLSATNTTSRLITAAARPLSSNVNQLGGFYFALPVTLRGVGGPNIGD